MEVDVPVDYSIFLAQRGAFEGFVAGDDMPRYVELWSIEAIEGNNRDVEIAEYAPGFLEFAGNGGGEVLAFDSGGSVYMLPLIGMAPDTAVKVADCFADLAARFADSDEFGTAI